MYIMYLRPIIFILFSIPSEWNVIVKSIRCSPGRILFHEEKVHDLFSAIFKNPFCLVQVN